MPILYLNFTHIKCGRCMTSIENCLFRLGIDHFEFDVSDAMAKIIFDESQTSVDAILDCIHHLGYDPHIADLIEEDMDELNKEHINQKP